MDARLKMQDPRHQYPEPPFPKQPQPAPGLAAHMQPRPDHGETSYHGSGKLHGRKALVTGGDSGIGRAAAIASPAKAPMSPLSICPRKRRTRGR